MGLEKNCPITVGTMQTGARNLITDVPGVLVGHCTLSDGERQTGVTAILPHGGDLFHDKVVAAAHVFNGFGKSMGLVQLEEMGTIETPVLLTNTLSAGAVYDGLVRVMLEKYPDIGDTTGTVNPIICECNDGGINHIRGLFVGEAHVRQALASCAADFAEGAVGAGRGMRCHQCKGGIGSASRILTLDSVPYTLGALVLTNHGLWQDLVIGGDPVGRRLPLHREAQSGDKGSCIILLATDVPLSERQLKRVCRRSIIGLSRLGSYMANGSGEICLAFTTANRLSHYSERDILETRMFYDENIDRVFEAGVEAVEEAIVSSLYHGETTTGVRGNRYLGLREFIARYGK